MKEPIFRWTCDECGSAYYYTAERPDEMHDDRVCVKCREKVSLYLRLRTAYRKLQGLFPSYLCSIDLGWGVGRRLVVYYPPEEKNLYLQDTCDGFPVVHRRLA